MIRATDTSTTGQSSEQSSAVLSGRRGSSASAPVVTVDLTTELRWFFDGQPPDEVVAWFNRAGAGLVEERCDTYRLDGQVDIGVKRRFRKTLELKLRLRPPEQFQVGHELEGRLETWHRWSPADGRVFLTNNTIWIDIDKTVTKRRFGPDGLETPLTEETRAMTGDGCDVEIATVEVAGRKAWTFAFAAFGSVDRHHELLRSTWQALTEEQMWPRNIRLERDSSWGYPEWMAKAVPLP